MSVRQIVTSAIMAILMVAMSSGDRTALAQQSSLYATADLAEAGSDRDEERPNHVDARAGELDAVGLERYASQHQARDSTCTIEHRASAAPPVALVGETVATSLTVVPLCGTESHPLHVVLVLDASGSMTGERLTDMQDAAARFVQDLSPSRNPLVRIGVVSYNAQARVLIPLSSNEYAVLAAIRTIAASGGTAINAGIHEGLELLVTARPRGPRIQEAMVVVSDGANNGGCPPVLQAATQAKSQGVFVSTICIGPGCDAQCLRQVASGARHFHQTQTYQELEAAFDRIREDLLSVVLNRLRIRVVLGDDVRYVPDSAFPPALVMGGGSSLGWQEDYVPRTGHTYSFEVEPLRRGQTTAFQAATGEFVDWNGDDGEFEVERPWILLLEPLPLPVP